MSQTPGSLHVACGQIVCRPGDLDHNLDQMDALASRAADAGSRLVLFGEGAITGYLLTEEVLQMAPGVDSDAARRLLEISGKYHIVTVAGTLATDEDGHHVSAFIAYPDGKLLVQHKHNLTPTEREAGIVPGPEERILFDVDGVRCAVCICADGGIEDIRNKLARQGCQVYLAPTAGGAGREHMVHEAELDNPERHRTYLQDMEKVCFMGHAIGQCRANRMALVATNLSGDDGVGNYHPGHSSIVDSRGCTVALIPGEYVVEWLRPRLIAGEIIVQEPREA